MRCFFVCVCGTGTFVLCFNSRSHPLVNPVTQEEGSGTKWAPMMLTGLVKEELINLLVLSPQCIFLSFCHSRLVNLDKPLQRDAVCRSRTFKGKAKNLLIWDPFPSGRLFLPYVLKK